MVANRPATMPTLLQEIERRAAARPRTFALLIPDAARSATPIGRWRAPVGV